ncbi:hypothetical protein QL285_049538 [Trifolium repens]|nr:hypothetical protein QL285_049538 [Trifolium repens]
MKKYNSKNKACCVQCEQKVAAMLVVDHGNCNIGQFVSSTRKSNKRRLSKWQFTDNISCKFGNGKEIDFWRDKCFEIAGAADSAGWTRSNSGKG